MESFGVSDLRRNREPFIGDSADDKQIKLVNKRFYHRTCERVYNLFTFLLISVIVSEFVHHS